MRWYESLMFYGSQEGQDKSDADLKLIPNLIEKVLLPKLTGIDDLIMFSLQDVISYSYLGNPNNIVPQYNSLNR